MNPADERVLSSAATIWLKWGMPAVWLPPLGALACVTIVDDVRNIVPSLIFLACMLYFAVWHFPLKKVTATPAGLEISNYITTISVPYAQIHKVRECKFLGHRPVTVLLKRPCRFGRRIKFTPRGHWYYLFWWLRFKDHPVATWLRDTACQGDPAS